MTKRSQRRIIEKSTSWAPYLLALLFVALILFDIFTTKIGFTDAAEYINVAKDLAGLNKSNVYIFHAVSYSLFLAQFLKLFPYLLTLKIINSLWLVLIGFLLYKVSKNKDALLLWVFSPVVYIEGIGVNSVLPSAFFFLLAYYSYKLYMQDNKLRYLIFIGIYLGVETIFRDADLVPITLFMVIFMGDIKFRNILYIIASFLATYSIKGLIDYAYFGIPFYTTLLYLGAQTYYYAGTTFITKSWFLSPFVITPLTFLLYRSKEKKELAFIILSYLYFSILAHIRLLILIAPIAIMMLVKVMSKKEIYTSIILSFVLTAFLTYGYFGDNEENLIKKDLQKIEGEFDQRIFVTGNGGAYFYPALYWNDFHYIWLRDYDLNSKNQTNYAINVLSSKPKIRDSKIVEFSASVKVNRDKIIYSLNKENFLFLFERKEVEYNEKYKILIVKWFGDEIIVHDVEKIKCYEKLCLFKPIK